MWISLVLLRLDEIVCKENQFKLFNNFSPAINLNVVKFCDNEWKSGSY